MASKMIVALLVWSSFCGAVVQAQDFDFFYFVQQVGYHTLLLAPQIVEAAASML